MGVKDGTLPWPDEPVRISSEWVEDEDLTEEQLAIEEDAEHPQLIAILDTREEAYARAGDINDAHGGRPFLVFIAGEDGGPGDEYLVTAAPQPFTSGRWGVYLVIETTGC